MPEEKRPLKVFLCHASQDKPVVRELRRRLNSEGWIKPWIDEKNLLPGQDWRLKIEEAVETSDTVIICLSTNSVNKEGHVQKELRYAREIALEKPEDTIFLIPLRLDECDIPRGLRFYQWVDYFGDKKDGAYKALIASLKLRHEQKLRLAEAERARQEKARQEREAAEIAVREKAEREAAEKAAREKVEREAAEKVAREIAEREALEKALREKDEREAFEKIAREKKEREAARKAVIKRTLTKPFTFLKSTFLQTKPILRIAGIIGIILILFGIGSWAMPRFNSLISPEKTSATRSPVPQITFTAVVPRSTEQLKIEDLKVAFALDTSGIMAKGQTFSNLLEATSSSISGFKGDEEIAVYSFNEAVTLDVNATNDFNSALEKVQSLEAVPDSGACLYDAIYEVFQQVSALDGNNWVIVVIADGRDQNLQGEICSKARADVVVRNMTEKQNPVPVYIIALGNYYIQDDILGAISTLTQGSFTRADSAQLENTLSELLDQLRITPGSQYNFPLTADTTPTPTSTELPSSSSLPLSTEIIPVETLDDFGIEMMLIPAGEFTMGSENGGSDERPVHTVNLEAFYMDKFEVTNALYKACVKAGICEAPFQSSLYPFSTYYGNTQYGDYPIVYVNWFMAKTYCEWRNAKLPTEAQWEKAARSMDGRTYPWGEGIDCEKANYGGCKANLTKVGSYEDGQSPYGLYDMVGNVSEWVEDWYQAYSGGDPNATNSYGEINRVLRGGSWTNVESELYITNRFWAAPLSTDNYRGFRCTRDVLQ